MPRGSAFSSSRGGAPMRLANEAITVPYNHPAPYGGWNARGNLANMDPTEAIQMDNLFPGVQQVELRKGCSDWATGAPATLHSLLPYTGSTVNKLFAATNAGIFDITAAGPFGAPAVACTNGFWKSVMMTTAGGHFLFGVNGTDLAKTFDGAAWAVPAITVANSANWNYVSIFKKRIWAVEKNSMNLWYLAVESIAGAATKFPVGALFKKGGYVVAIGAWTIDGGSGTDDLFVILTSNGEIAVYQGTDPNSSTTWSLIGTYEIAKPIGDKPLLDYGGDLLCLTATGLLPLSRLTQSTILDRSSNISYNIDGAFIDAAEEFSDITGWQIITHKSANILLVNVPITQDVLSYQFVMNTTTKKWCRFTGWNASSWIDFNNDIYFTAGNKVQKAWDGTSDAGAPITGLVMQAYSRMGSKLQKKIELARLTFGFTGAAQVIMALDADFKTFNGQTEFTYIPSGAGGIWDLSLWDAALWDAGVAVFDPRWTTVPGDLGYMHSFRMQVIASSGNFVWTATDFAEKAAGIL